MLQKRFGRLVVLAKNPERTKDRSIRWDCRCDCGNMTTLATHTLTSGNTRSCGCLKLEVAGTQLVTHGLSRTPEHIAWKLMRQRCFNKNHQNYADYKDRAPSPEFEDFEVFLKEIGPRPSPKHSLDRIKNELGYVKGNIRWATKLEQSNNTRTNVMVLLKGELLSLTEACRRTGLNYRTIAWRWRQWKDMSRASNGLFNIPG